MARTRQDRDDERKDGFRDRVEELGRRLQEEAKGAESRVKEGIKSALEESKHPETRFGRPPKRPPPSGRPPSARH